MQSFQITRRNLPHWQEPGRVYFITWRCQNGKFLSPAERTITLKAFCHWDNKKWTLYAAVVLPDHVHGLAQPLLRDDGGAFDLGEILHSIKRFSARKINQARGDQGSLWQDERYDRIIRDEAEFLEKWQYIRNNPVKEGLAPFPEEYPWLYEKDEKAHNAPAGSLCNLFKITGRNGPGRHEFDLILQKGYEIDCITY